MPTVRIIRVRCFVPRWVKFVVGLIALTALALFAVSLIGLEAGQYPVNQGPIVAPSNQYDPVTTGEPRPDGFRQLLPRDAILPVYNPTFRTVSTTDWDDDILVIGVAMDGEAKAYQVSFLNRREMAIDWIGGSPVLVIW